MSTTDSKSIYDNSFFSTELTKITIDPIATFSTNEKEMHLSILAAQEYMNDQGYDELLYVKYSHKSCIKPGAIADIFVDVCRKFETVLTCIDILSIMSEHFNIQYNEMYEALTPNLKSKLHKQLLRQSEYTQQDIDKATTLDNNSGMYTPSL